MGVSDVPMYELQVKPSPHGATDGSSGSQNGYKGHVRSVSDAGSIRSRGSSVNSRVSAVEVPSKPQEKARGEWGSQLEFILTIVGYAVGLGNVWRFPYLTYKNGGGAFLIPYVIMLVCCGLPVFFFEVCFGQFASLGPLKIWVIAPMFKGVGVALVCVSTLVCLSYHILLAYIIYYFIASMTDRLPWVDCENSWNTYKCLTAEEFKNKTYFNMTLDAYNMTKEEVKTPAEEFYYRNVLQLSDGISEPGAVVWQLALCLLLAWLLVFLALIKGIKSLGKVVYFTSTFPYIMMTVMVVRGCTLEGALSGIEYYIIPDVSKLADGNVWVDAASQIFYSLSTCTGGLIAMASYNKFNNNALRDSIMVPIINCCTSIYSGFAIFTVLGFMATIKDVSIDDVAASGPGLVFVVYAEGLSQMPAAPVWSVLFFFMMLTLAFSSAFSMVEGVFVAILDEFSGYLRINSTRPIVFRAVMCVIFYLISLPMVTQGGFYIFNILDSYAGGLPRLFTGLGELVVVTWVYGINRFSEDIQMMLGRKPNIYFKVCWVFVAPCIVVTILVMRAIQSEPSKLFSGPDTYTYPAWADAMGWMMIGFVVVWIPVMMVVQWFIDGLWQIMKFGSSPTPDWGPAEVGNRKGRYADDDFRRMGSYKPDRKLGPDNMSLNPSMNYMSDAISYVSTVKVDPQGIDNTTFRL